MDDASRSTINAREVLGPKLLHTIVLYVEKVKFRTLYTENDEKAEASPTSLQAYQPFINLQYAALLISSSG